MNIGRQPSGQRTQESGCALVGQQVKIVNKNIAGPLTGQRMTQIVDQQTASLLGDKQIGKQEYEELLRRDLTAEKNDLNVEGGEKQ